MCGLVHNSLDIPPELKIEILLFTANPSLKSKVTCMAWKLRASWVGVLLLIALIMLSFSLGERWSSELELHPEPHLQCTVGTVLFRVLVRATLPQSPSTQMGRCVAVDCTDIP